MRIGDDCVIGANAVVTKSFLGPWLVIDGVPAKVIGTENRELVIKGAS